jgi:hypothetical protein
MSIQPRFQPAETCGKDRFGYCCYKGTIKNIYLKVFMRKKAEYVLIFSSPYKLQCFSEIAKV